MPLCRHATTSRPWWDANANRLTNIAADVYATSNHEAWTQAVTYPTALFYLTLSSPVMSNGYTIQGHTGLTKLFNFFLTLGHSGAQC